MNQPQMTRKERRALAFGTTEQRRAVESKYAPPAPHPVQEKDNKIVIPHIDPLAGSVLPFMLPMHDLKDYQERTYLEGSTGKTAKTISDYQQLTQKWFFSALQEFKPVMRPNVVSSNPDHTPYQAFLRHLRFMLESRDASHQHKIAYVSYVLDTCCTEIVWTSK